MLRDKEAGHCAVAFLNLTQVADHLVRLCFAANDPVANESIVGHQGGDKHRAQQVLLDFGIDIIAGQGEGVA